MTTTYIMEKQENIVLLTTGTIWPTGSSRMRIDDQEFHHLAGSAFHYNQLELADGCVAGLTLQFFEDESLAKIMCARMCQRFAKHVRQIYFDTVEILFVSSCKELTEEMNMGIGWLLESEENGGLVLCIEIYADRTIPAPSAVEVEYLE